MKRLILLSAVVSGIVLCGIGSAGDTEVLSDMEAATIRGGDSRWNCDSDGQCDASNCLGKGGKSSCTGATGKYRLQTHSHCSNYWGTAGPLNCHQETRDCVYEIACSYSVRNSGCQQDGAATGTTTQMHVSCSTFN